MASILSPIRAKVVDVNGGNLFQIAAQYLGDATQWNRIAKLNGLIDPQLNTGVPIPLKIPPVNPALSNGGILGI